MTGQLVVRVMLAEGRVHISDDRNVLELTLSQWHAVSEEVHRQIFAPEKDQT